MTHVLIINGLAYVTYDDYAKGDYDLPHATGLTKEDARAAAWELLRASFGLIDDAEQARRNEAFRAELRAATEKRGPVTIAGFAGPFDSKVPGSFAVIEFGKEKP